MSHTVATYDWNPGDTLASALTVEVKATEDDENPYRAVIAEDPNDSDYTTLPDGNRQATADEAVQNLMDKHATHIETVEGASPSSTVETTVDGTTYSASKQ